MTCKNCGAELQADTFCGECGSKVESRENEAIKCSECGKFFDKEFGICPFCGAELDVAEEAPVEIIPVSENTAIADTEVTAIASDNDKDMPAENAPSIEEDENIYSGTPMAETVGGDGDSQLLSDPVSIFKDEENIPSIESLSGIHNEESNCSDKSFWQERGKWLVVIAVIIFAVVIFIWALTEGDDDSRIDDYNTASSASSQDSSSDFWNTDNEDKDGSIGVSGLQIKDDIYQQKKVINGVASSRYTPDAAYTVENIELVKRQTNLDEKEDIVYCDVTISNIYYRSVLSFMLKYNYYDYGGWILDDVATQATETVPIGPVDKDSISIIYTEVNERTVTLDSQHITDIVFDSNALSSTIYYHYTDSTLSAKGYLTIHYEDGIWGRAEKHLFTLSEVDVLWESPDFLGAYSGEGRSLSFPDLFGNGIGDFYFVDEGLKADEDQYFKVDVPDYGYTLNITDLYPESNTLEGTIAIDGEDYDSLGVKLEKDVYYLPFKSEYNPSNGYFNINTTIDVYTYRYLGYKDIRDAHYVPVDITLSFQYSFSNNKWYVCRSVINEVKSGEGTIVCSYRTKWNNTHND